MIKSDSWNCSDCEKRFLSTRKMNTAIVNAVARKTTARYEVEAVDLAGMPRALKIGADSIRLVFTHAEAADEGEFDRGLVKVDAEGEAQKIDFEAFLAGHG